MRVLLLGKIGQLGWELEQMLTPCCELTVWDYPEINFTSPDELAEKAEAANAQIIINAVGYTDVDRAESDRETARLINTAAVEKLAHIAKKQGAALIHYSTDYVFDGHKNSPYLETDTTHPLGIYGLTKREGEQAIQASGCAHWILRTSWLYSTRRDNFVLKVLQWARKYPTLKIVSDQISNPTWAHTLAEATLAIVQHSNTPEWLAEHSGIYHVAGGGFTSRYEWALEILKNDPRSKEQIVKEILPALTVDFPTPAIRPLYSALDCSKFEKVSGYHLPNWKDALRKAMENFQTDSNAR